MSYHHIGTLTSTVASATTGALRAKGLRVAVQAKGGAARVKFGTGGVVATTTADLRVFADQAPVEVQLLPGEDEVAMISEDGSTSVTLEVLDAT